MFILVLQQGYYYKRTKFILVRRQLPASKEKSCPRENLMWKKAALNHDAICQGFQPLETQVFGNLVLWAEQEFYSLSWAGLFPHPRNSYVEALLPVLQNVTVFRHKAFKEVIKLDSRGTDNPNPI